MAMTASVVDPRLASSSLSPFGMPASVRNATPPRSVDPTGGFNPFVTNSNLTNSRHHSMAAPPAVSGAYPSANLSYTQPAPPQTSLGNSPRTMMSGGFAPTMDGQASMPSNKVIPSFPVGGAFPTMPMPMPSMTIPPQAVIASGPQPYPVSGSLKLGLGSFGGVAPVMTMPHMQSMPSAMLTQPVMPASSAASLVCPPQMGSVKQLEPWRVSQGNLGHALNPSLSPPVDTLPYYPPYGGTMGSRTVNPFGMRPASGNYLEQQTEQASNSSDDERPHALEEDEDDYEQIISRNPLQSRTGTDFGRLGEVPDAAFSHLYAPQAHDLSRVEHRLRQARQAADFAQAELHNAEMQMHGMQGHLHNHVLDPVPPMRHVDTDPTRIYPSGAPVLHHGGGIQEVDPYPFWIGAGTPAARLEPTWIGGEWYLVAPVDFKGLENSGMSKEMQNAQLRVVDDALHHLDSQVPSQLPAFPPPRHWKEHKNCPIA